MLLSLSVTARTAGGNISRLLPSGTCQEWLGEPRECESVIGNRQVFVPTGTNQSELASLLDGQLEDLIFAPLSCREPSLVLACGIFSGSGCKRKGGRPYDWKVREQNTHTHTHTHSALKL